MTGLSLEDRYNTTAAPLLSFVWSFAALQELDTASAEGELGEEWLDDLDVPTTVKDHYPANEDLEAGEN
eukprot:28582-Eustigmatos_ZCMA.PRE.1